jgi:hypothetical protein
LAQSRVSCVPSRLVQYLVRVRARVGLCFPS